jgi:uncharacterized SAM-binding protein YcdF (DUF218 family)
MDIIRERGGGRIILVTSSYHTRRAFLSFSAFQKNIPIEIYVYGTVNAQKTMAILSETVKLFFIRKYSSSGMEHIQCEDFINMAR